MPRITAIETAIPHGIMSNLLLLRVHTDDGLVGCGETYYTPHAVAALIHDWMAPRLIAGDLAEQLVAEGYKAVKFWPFDRAAHRSGGLHISWQDVEEGMKPLRAMRDRVGMKLDIAIEGHAFFQLPAALRIAEALREIKPLWLEDVLRVDCVATLADFREKSGLPIAASEMLLGRKEYLQVLQAGAADYCMLDPTWTGGISESRRVIDLAQTFNVPATIHDCTGPLNLFAGLHLAAASANVAFQETVRAHIRTLYSHLVDRGPVIDQGYALLPEGPGLGTRLHDALFMPGKHSYRRSG